VKQKIENKLRAKLGSEIQCTKEMIRVIPHAGKFNFRCFENAVEFARLNPDHAVIEVMYIEKGEYPILHYINQAPDGTYLETTLGYRADNLDYYKMRVIHPDDYKAIGWLFDTALDYWSSKYVKWWHRLLRISRLA